MQPRRTIPPGGAIAKRVWGTQVEESESASDGQKSMFPPMFAVLGFRGQSTAVRFASLYGGGRSQLRCLGWYNKVGRPFFFPLMGFFRVSVWGSGSDRLKRIPFRHMPLWLARVKSIYRGEGTTPQQAQMMPPRNENLSIDKAKTARCARSKKKRGRLARQDGTR